MGHRSATPEEVDAWYEEAKDGPSRVVYDDIGEKYKQRSVVFTYGYQRYLALIRTVRELWERNRKLEGWLQIANAGLEQHDREHPECGKT
jgi:ADP-glucose pyrophosphorylase